MKNRILMMRKTIIISMLFCVSIACKAQSRYCMTYEDFVKGNWVTVDTFIVTKRTKTEKFMVGGRQEIGDQEIGDGSD